MAVLVFSVVNNGGIRHFPSLRREVKLLCALLFYKNRSLSLSLSCCIARLITHHLVRIASTDEDERPNETHKELLGAAGLMQFLHHRHLVALFLLYTFIE